MPRSNINGAPGRREVGPPRVMRASCTPRVGALGSVAAPQVPAYIPRV